MIKLKGKELNTIIMNLLKVIDMKAILEMIIKKEKEFIIIIMVIDMKEILEMVNQKEKELYILIMEIE